MKKKTIEEITAEIDLLKKELAKMWESKERTDRDILICSEMIDHLLNQHDQILAETAIERYR